MVDPRRLTIFLEPLYRKVRNFGSFRWNFLGFLTFGPLAIWVPELFLVTFSFQILPSKGTNGSIILRMPH